MVNEAKVSEIAGNKPASIDGVLLRSLKCALRFIPPFNMPYMCAKQLKHEISPAMERFHLAYAGCSVMILGVSIGLWILKVQETGVVNPIDQVRVSQRQNDAYERFLDCHHMIFDGKGLADANKDGTIQPAELADAVNRMINEGCNIFVYNISVDRLSWKCSYQRDDNGTYNMTIKHGGKIEIQKLEKV